MHLKVKLQKKKCQIKKTTILVKDPQENPS